MRGGGDKNKMSKLFQKEKKGQLGLGQLPNIAITLVVVGIVFAIGLQIVSDTGDDMTANSAEQNATEETVEGMAKVTGKLPLIGTVVAAVVVLGLVIGGLAFRNQ